MIGQVIRDARKKKGLSQTELAELLEVYQATVSKWERGDREPSGEHLDELARALGIDTDEIRSRAREARPTPQDGSRYVQSRDDISKWRDAVISDQDLSDGAQLVLMGLPAFLDKTAWVVPITVEGFVDRTGRTMEIVEEHWEEVLGSDYVKRLGENRWTLMLRIPEQP